MRERILASPLCCAYPELASPQAQPISAAKLLVHDTRTESTQSGNLMMPRAKPAKPAKGLRETRKLGETIETAGRVQVNC